MVAGVALGKLVPAVVQALRGLEFGQGSQINAPIAVLIWLMITPMMMKVDFTAIRNVGRKPAGLVVTLIVNWLVKPFSMAFVWSHLTNGDAAYTLVQVSVNDLIMLVAFVPLVQFLVTGASSLAVPFRVLLYSVIVFIVIPLAAGALLRRWWIGRRGKDCSSELCCPALPRSPSRHCSPRWFSSLPSRRTTSPTVFSTLS